MGAILERFFKLDFGTDNVFDYSVHEQQLLLERLHTGIDCSEKRSLGHVRKALKLVVGAG